MRFRLIPLILLLAFAAFAAEPVVQQSIATAKKNIDEGKNAEAIKVLDDAIVRAKSIKDDSEKNAALAAIHFYSALAWTHDGNEKAARKELESFFGLAKSRVTLDPKKFDPKFVSLFNDVQKSAKRATSVFDSLYPGFDPSGDAKLSPEDELNWETSAEFTLLGNDGEHAAYAALKTAEERAAFVSDFWVKHSPETPSAEEYRDIVRRRIAFADAAFGSPFLRGAVTDRGRVFVLLGPPANIHAAAMSRATGATIPLRSAQGIDGQTETWVYFRRQLPKAVPKQQVNFVFITQEGYGDHVMQKELFALKVLDEAKKMLPER